MRVGYNGSAESGWRFAMAGGGFEADLEVQRTTEPFTKFDNEFVDDHGLLRFFGNLARGQKSFVKRHLVSAAVQIQAHGVVRTRSQAHGAAAGARGCLARIHKADARRGADDRRPL